MNLDRIAKALRQVPPGNASAIAVENGFDKPPIVLRRRPNITFTSRQKILDPVPLVVPQSIASHWSAPNQLTSHESLDAPIGNPVIEDRP
jgi:hypothetical protein